MDNYAIEISKDYLKLFNEVDELKSILLNIILEKDELELIIC